jgi:hypothetical protein
MYHLFYFVNHHIVSKLDRNDFGILRSVLTRVLEAKQRGELTGNKLSTVAYLPITKSIARVHDQDLSSELYKVFTLPIDESVDHLVHLLSERAKEPEIKEAR